MQIRGQGEIAVASEEQQRGNVVAPRTKLSMFSGCGGLDLGFLQAGFRTVWANDVNEDACRTYRRNIGEIIEGDIWTIEPPSLPTLDMLTGGFPCQPFSNAGSRRGLVDSRGHLYKRCLDYIEVLSPKIVMFENVRGMLTIKGAKGYLVDEICEALLQLDYEVHLKLVNAAHYGVPQNRIRVVIVGVKRDPTLGQFRFPRKVEGLDLTLGTCLSVPPDTPNQSDLVQLNPQALYLGTLVPEGGSWKDIPYDLLPDRLKRIRDDMRRYRWPNFYRRFSRDEVAGTITAAFKPENAGVWHPTEDRVLSAREIARIQSFPDEFVFEARSVKRIYELIGNAVPPKLAYAFAQVFLHVLEGKDYDNGEEMQECRSIASLGRPVRPRDPELLWVGG